MSTRFEQALQSLEILREVNMVVVPIAPTKAMIDIGASVGGVDLQVAQIVYEAMVNFHVLTPVSASRLDA